MKLHVAALAALCVTAANAQAIDSPPQPDPQASRLDTVQVTATRFGEAVQAVPTSISVVTGQELRDRGVSDLRSALALLGGAGVAPGGDSGPAGAVPALLGLREADDFLLLIDGVPAGGVFTPPFETISFGNVERIEVLRGTAPVYYGTTAFAGTINIIHYAAGQADPTLYVSYGSFGSASVRGAKALSSGTIKQSLAVDFSRDRLSDPRSRFDRAQANYRLATEVADGQVRLDLNVLALNQNPGSPTPIGDDGRLNSELPIDFNQNPSDAKLNTRRHQLVLGYDKLTTLGRWGTTLSLTQTRVDALRGFLVEGGLDLPGENAQGVRQYRSLRDVYFDTHLTSSPMPGLDVTWGVNELYGRVNQSSSQFSYRVDPDADVQGSAAGTPGDSTRLQDRRSFFGLYIQSRLALNSRASLLAGLRWSHTVKTRRTAEDDATLLDETQRNSRLSGSFGGQWKVWQDPSGDLDDVTLFASVGHTFQPAQLDFGTEAGTQPLLKPETQRSAVVGVKVDGADGRFDVDIAAFFSDFANQPVARQVNGNAVLQNGGNQRYQGAEIEASWRPLPSWTLATHASYGQARYGATSAVLNGAHTTLDGRDLALSPRLRTGASIVFAPQRGWRFSITASHTGSRYLDALNATPVGGFTVVDSSIAYRFARWSVSIAGTNLTNRRDPVLASELGESQFYRLPGRRVFLTLSAAVD